MEYKYAPKYLQEEFTLENIIKALDEGFNVNSYYEFWNKLTFLMQAVKRGKKNIVAYLLENGVSASHLVKRKPSLEQQFLDLTNNQ